MASNYKYFLDDQYLGKWNYGKYIKIDVKPGSHVFWLKIGSITSFVTANLKAGESYILDAVYKMGLSKSAVTLIVPSNLDEKVITKVNRCLTKKQIPYNHKSPHRDQNKMNPIITKGLDTYELKKLNGDITTLLHPANYGKYNIQQSTIKAPKTIATKKIENSLDNKSLLKLEKRSKQSLAEIFSELNTAIDEAVKKENYDTAESLKNEIKRIEQNKAKIEALEKEKLTNLLIEDYDKVIELEEQINRLKI